MSAPARTAATRALAPLALMGLIFFLSAQPDLDSGLGTLDTILRKLAHFGVYGALTLLWAWAPRPVTAKALPLAVAIALAYAVTDEYHQSFVTGRSGSPIDVAIDSVGIAAAYTLLRVRPHAPARLLTPLLRRTRDGAKM